MSTVYRIDRTNGVWSLQAGHVVQVGSETIVLFRAKMHHMSGECWHVSTLLSEWKDSPASAHAVPVAAMEQRHKSERADLDKVIPA